MAEQFRFDVRYSPDELARFCGEIQDARRASLARSEEMFRCVEILTDMAFEQDEISVSKALLAAAKRILAGA